MERVLVLDTKRMGDTELEDLVAYIHVIAPIESRITPDRIQCRATNEAYSLLFWTDSHRLSLLSELGMKLAAREGKVIPIEHKLGFFIALNKLYNET